MNAIWLAIIGIIGGVVTGLIPSVALTERARRLRAVRDTNALLKDIDPGPAQQTMSEALKSHSDAYLTWINEPSPRRAGRQALGVMFVLMPISLMAWAVSLITGTDIPATFTTTFRLISWSTLGVVVLFVLRFLLLVFSTSEQYEGIENKLFKARKPSTPDVTNPGPPTKEVDPGS